MKSSCSICSDFFDELNNIVALPCGHTFHEICLRQWFDHSKTCPTCRKSVTQKNILRLFFHLVEEREGLSSDALYNEVENLKAKLRQKDMEKKKLEDDIVSIRFFVKKAESESDEAKQKYYDSETQVTALKMQIKHMSKQLSEIDRLLKENIALKKELTLLKNVESVISGTQHDVEEILKGCSERQEDIKQIATYCSLLKRELINVVDSKTQLRGDITRLKKELGYKVAELKDKNEELKCTKETLKILEQENDSLMLKKNIEINANNNPSSAKSSVIYESPTPERLKNKLFDHLENETRVTPVSERPTFKKLKMNVLSSETHEVRIPSEQNRLSFSNLKSSLFKKTVLKNEKENSIIRSGYNGLGGHCKFINRSSPVISKSKQGLKRSLKTTTSCTLNNFITL